jgi:diguanylate cyclase (GGDEF)-like protein
VLAGYALDPRPFDLVLVALIVLAAFAAIAAQRTVESLETGRRAEAESFTRILRGLARSVSPDAIVEAIVEELGTGTAADHVVVVRRRPESRILDATLHATRPGVPTSSTALPITDLDDPAIEVAAARASMRAARGRSMAAIPIEPELDGLPAALMLVTAGGPSGGASPQPAPSLTLAPSTLIRTAAGPRDARFTRVHATSTRDGAGSRIADRIGRRVREVYGLQHTVAAPLVVGERIEGAIVLSRRTAGPWSPAALRILDAAAVEASAALARVYTMRRAETRASTDALTSLPNRRYFDEYVALLSTRRRADDRLGVLMVDIDRFKRLNDTFGHAVGDHVLRAVAGAIAGAVREDDVPARFGGEEFAVLLRNPSPEVAYEVGERVRKAVGELDLRTLGVPAVSVSVGVAVASEPGGVIEDLIEEADRALYRAKRAGRDRVVAA